MLKIQESHVQAILEHAYREHPLEACGLIAGGRDNSQRRLIHMDNAARSETFFQFDPRQQLRVWQEMEDREETPLVFYHSHTHSRAFPSREDIQHAWDPRVHYLLVSTATQSRGEVRSYRIIDGRVSEEATRILRGT